MGKNFNSVYKLLTYVFGSGFQDIVWDRHIRLVDYKHLHSDTLGYKLLKRAKKRHLDCSKTTMLYTDIEPILVSATYVFGSGSPYILWDSRICLVQYKHLHSDTLGCKLLKEDKKMTCRLLM